MPIRGESLHPLATALLHKGPNGDLLDISAIEPQSPLDRFPGNSVKKLFNRRDFLRTAGVAAGSLALAACGVKSVPVIEFATAAPVPASGTLAKPDSDPLVAPISPTNDSRPTQAASQIPNSGGGGETPIPTQAQAPTETPRPPQTILQELGLSGDVIPELINDSYVVKGKYVDAVLKDGSWQLVNTSGFSPRIQYQIIQSWPGGEDYFKNSIDFAISTIPLVKRELVTSSKSPTVNGHEKYHGGTRFISVGVVNIDLSTQVFALPSDFVQCLMVVDAADYVHTGAIRIMPFVLSAQVKGKWSQQPNLIEKVDGQYLSFKATSAVELNGKIEPFIGKVMNGTFIYGFDDLKALDGDIYSNPGSTQPSEEIINMMRLSYIRSTSGTPDISKIVFTAPFFYEQVVKNDPNFNPGLWVNMLFLIQ